MSGSLVSPGLRARVRGLAEPLARGIGRLGLTPNHLTFLGFVIAITAAAAAAAGAWLAAGLLVVFGGAFDLFDGTLARATGRASRIGAFYDSVFDRWGEGIVYVGVAWGLADAGHQLSSVLAGAALVSAFMVSYTRAKSESLGFTPGTGMANVGLAPREVRIAILTVGLVATGLLEAASAPTVLGGTLGLITALATVTTVQRILHARVQAREG